MHKELEPLAYTINEAAELMRVHRATVYRPIVEGKLERVCIGPQCPASGPREPG